MILLSLLGAQYWDIQLAAGDYRAKIIVPDVPIEGYATFKAEVANAAKYTLFVTEDDIPSNENVFVDTIRPNIELVGPENYIVPMHHICMFIRIELLGLITLYRIVHHICMFQVLLQLMGI